MNNQNITIGDFKRKMVQSCKVSLFFIRLTIVTLNGEASEFEGLIEEIKRFDVDSGILIAELLDSYDYETIINL